MATKVDCIKSTDVARDVDGSNAPPASTEEGDSIGNKVGPGGDDDMVAPSIPPPCRNPDRAVRSARGGSVASLRTSDEPTDIVVDPSSSDNIFEHSSDNDSTEDVFSLSAYEQVKSEDSDSDDNNKDDKSNEDHDDEDHEDEEGRDEEMTN